MNDYFDDANRGGGCRGYDVNSSGKGCSDTPSHIFGHPNGPSVWEGCQGDLAEGGRSQGIVRLAGKDYADLLEGVKETLQKADDPQEIVQLVGNDHLPNDQECTLGIARVTR